MIPLLAAPTLAEVNDSIDLFERAGQEMAGRAVCPTRPAHLCGAPRPRPCICRRKTEEQEVGVLRGRFGQTRSAAGRIAIEDSFGIAASSVRYAVILEIAN